MMRRPLYGRFRGCFLGLAIGEILCADQHQFQSQHWSQLMALTTKSLIQAGKFDRKDWQQRWNLNSTSTGMTVAHGMVATLAIALFDHENKIKLRQNILSLMDGWQHDPISTDAALAIGYVLAQCLRGQLNAATIIPETMAFLGKTSPLLPVLGQVQTLVEQTSGLDRAVAQLNSDSWTTTSMAVSFFCFLTTLEDFRLSTKRATSSKVAPQLTAVLTGALSGAHNTYLGIPAKLQLLTSKIDNGVILTAQMLNLADDMLTIWSGVYDQSLPTHGLLPLMAIAAPENFDKANLD